METLTPYFVFSFLQSIPAGFIAILKQIFTASELCRAELWVVTPKRLSVATFTPAFVVIWLSDNNKKT